LAAAQAAPSGSGQWVVPRTPDGRPDLQGNWSSATITPLQQFSHTPRSVWVGRPIPQLIKIGDHLIRGDGLLLTGDGRSFQIHGEHRWDLLERVGDGFITHYDKQTQTIWYITPKQE
jgi:hypothetical protein